MKVTLWCCSLGCLLALVGCGEKKDSGPGAAASSEGWQPFDPEQGKFVVQFPGKPTELPADTESSKGYSLDAGKLVYSIRYRDFAAPEGPDQPEKAAEEMFENLANTISIREDVEVVDQKPEARVGGQPAYDLLVETKDKKYKRIRFCVAGGRLYRMEVAGEKDAVTSPTPDLFFESLKFGK